MRILAAGLCALLLGALANGQTLKVSASCEGLVSVKLPNTTITLAQAVGSGAFTLPGSSAPAAAQTFSALPAFCRVAATLKPTSDSDIKIEVWLPASSWNGKFQAVGNGGWAGTIPYPAMAAAVAAGYATASTDGGHAGVGAAFALGHPEKVIDYAHRAVHEMTVQAKAILKAHYEVGPIKSFWNSCSTGVRQGITEAVLYPTDYDAIVAGSSALRLADTYAVKVALNVIGNRSRDSSIPSEKYPAMHSAVLDACDAIDGVKDGVIEDPSRCHFDPRVLECTNGDGPKCLTTAQIQTVTAFYSPFKHPATGKVLYPPFMQPGSELGWEVLAGPEPQGNAQEMFKYFVFNDAKWDWRRFRPETDLDLAQRIDTGVLNVTDPNLKRFFDRRGKLLMYHGWADPQVAPLISVNYFNDVVRTLGRGVVGNSIQLYMVPGMNHCRGGAGTDTFDTIAAIEQWVDKGKAPDQIIASHSTNGTVDRTRPLCPYSQVAVYKGSGSTDEAANFVCKAP